MRPKTPGISFKEIKRRIMRVAIVGSRKFENKEFLFKCVDEVIEDIKDNLYQDLDLIISGGAAGADSIAQLYARERGIPIMIFYPKWREYSRAAGPIRNQLIVDNCDAVIAFPVGEAKGTKDTLKKAAQKNRKVYIFKEAQ